MKGIFTPKTVIKIRGDCYFKFKNSNAKLQGTLKIKETLQYQKVIIIFQKLKPKTWRFMVYPRKNSK